MRYIKNIFLLLFLASMFACEKDITVDLPKPEPKVVIEGHIEPNEAAVVILTRSSAYFAPVDSESAKNSVIFGATVVVWDGSKTDTLKQTFDLNYFPPIIYRGNKNKVKGVIGKNYDLTVIVDGQAFTSTTTMVQAIGLDTAWFKTQPPSEELGFVWAKLSDPVGLGNHYRWFAKRVGKDIRFVAPFGSAFDDQFIDGKSFDFAYSRGVEFNSQAPDDQNEERGYFKMGDKVIVKFCSTDKASFDFYRSFETDAASNGNPFASPTTVKTNINGGALGVWGAYTPVFDTITLK